jgi:hypothetical protein
MVAKPIGALLVTEHFKSPSIAMTNDVFSAMEVKSTIPSGQQLTLLMEAGSKTCSGICW